MAILKTAYPTFYKNYSKEDVNAAVDLWATMFSEESIQVVTEAIKALMCTLKYPPTIADVKEKIAMITQPLMMTEMEAWSRVRGAISYYHANEAFANLPPMLQKIVGSPNVLKEWSQMDIETLNTVVQSNFMRSYKAKVAQEREYAMLPSSTKQLIAGLAQKYSLTEGKYELYSKCSTDVDKV
ncbi:MAG: replicative helicase loader/inhibitor [Bacteroidales bacterium]